MHPTAEIEEDVSIGERTTVWARTHVRRGAVVGDDCIVGENVFIDLGVRIGNRCKIQNGALVYRGAELADEVFVGPAACLTNDRHPRAAAPDGRLKLDSDWSVSGVRLEQGASVGAHAVIVGGRTVGVWAMVGAGAVVAADVAAHSLVVGSPARPAGWVCRCGERLDPGLACPACRRSYVLDAHGLSEAP